MALQAILGGCAISRGKRNFYALKTAAIEVNLHDFKGLYFFCIGRTFAVMRFVKGLHKVLMIWLGMVPFFVQAHDFPQDEQFREFTNSASTQFMANPKVNDFWGVWEPIFDAHDLNSQIRLEPKENQEDLTLYADSGATSQIKKSNNKFYVSDKKLSLKPNDWFVCRISASKELLICKAPCGSYYRVFERGNIGAESLSPLGD